MLYHVVRPSLICLLSSSDRSKLILQPSQTMPWHRKRRKDTDEIDGAQAQRQNEGSRHPAAPQSSSPRRSRLRSIFRRRKASPKATCYNHFASSVKASPEAITNDVEAMYEPNNWSTAIIALIAAVLLAICLALAPGTTFRAILFGQLLLCNFPPFLDNWILLIPILLPMKAQSRMEVVLGLGMLSWLGSLDWTYAWNRIQAWSLGNQHKRE